MRIATESRNKISGKTKEEELVERTPVPITSSTLSPCSFPYVADCARWKHFLKKSHYTLPAASFSGPLVRRKRVLSPLWTPPAGQTHPARPASQSGPGSAGPVVVLKSGRNRRYRPMAAAGYSRPRGN